MSGVTVQSVQNAIQAFGDRLQMNYYHTGITLAVLVLVIMLMWSSVNRYLAVPAAFGSAWLAWQTFNVFTMKPHVPMFMGEPKISQLFHYFGGSGPQFAAAAVGAVLGYTVFALSKRNRDHDKTPLGVRILGGVGTWFATVLVYAAGVSLSSG